ncbi:MAG: hypothetical protein SNJ29_14295 [Rikenellaceae bacterium]
MNLESTVRYVIGVLRSCKNKTQFEDSLPWGITAIVKSTAESRVKPRDHEGKRIEKIIPPRITSCKICGGTGQLNSGICCQCNGSGRVVVTSEIITYIKPFEP